MAEHWSEVPEGPYLREAFSSWVGCMPGVVFTADTWASGATTFVLEAERERHAAWRDVVNSWRSRAARG